VTVDVPLRTRDGRVRAVAIIDAADWPAVRQHRWYFDGMYPATRIGGHRGPKVRLHQFLLGEPPTGLEVDHRNRNKLDNRRRNLHWVTHLANGANMGARGGSSAHRGVTWDSARGKWRAQARRNYRMYGLGRFDQEEDAAEAVRRFWAQFDA
jgi:hypothetical protein